MDSRAVIVVVGFIVLVYSPTWFFLLLGAYIAVGVAQGPKY